MMFVIAIMLIIAMMIVMMIVMIRNFMSENVIVMSYDLMMLIMVAMRKV